MHELEMYEITRDRWGDELVAEAETYDAAVYAARHLIKEDGEDAPLFIQHSSLNTYARVLEDGTVRR